MPPIGFSGMGKITNVSVCEGTPAERCKLFSNQYRATRPTAVNLAWAVERQLSAIAQVSGVSEKVARAEQVAADICDEDSDWCRRIGEHGLVLIQEIADHGSATAPIYAAHDAGIPVHVWVDETRPRNQGARLTAWELGQHGVPHTVIVDNAGTCY